MSWLLSLRKLALPHWVRAPTICPRIWGALKRKTWENGEANCATWMTHLFGREPWERIASLGSKLGRPPILERLVARSIPSPCGVPETPLSAVEAQAFSATRPLAHVRFVRACGGIRNEREMRELLETAAPQCCLPPKFDELSSRKPSVRNAHWHQPKRRHREGLSDCWCDLGPAPMLEDDRPERSSHMGRCASC